MAKAVPDTSGAPDTQLAVIAQSVRGSFQTVEDMAQEFIREAIHQGAFPPGQRLNLDRIAATLGVSRMPIRASLRQLEAEGLVRVHPHRGATVAVLDAKEIQELYEMRILLESHLLKRAMQNLDDSVLKELEAIVADLETSTDLSSSLEKRRGFYQLLYARADRPRTVEQVNQLRGSVGRYLLLQRVDEHRGHEAFLGHLRASDVEAATNWLTGHLEHVSKKLQQMVREAESETPDGVGSVHPRLNVP